MEVQLKIVFFFIFMNSVLAQQGRLSSNVEWRALLKLRGSLGIRAREWPRKADPCLNWTGIECREGRVAGINLSGLRRTKQGRLNPRFAVDSLANLAALKSFNSSGFSLPGSIPHWFGQRLSALQVLDLSSSSILGLLPTSLGRLSRLSYLSLSNNSITGTIPTAFGKLLSLQILDLSRNSLTGLIPSAFSALENLTSLNLSNNLFYGNLTSEIGKFRSIDLSNNYFEGLVPRNVHSSVHITYNCLQNVTSQRNSKDCRLFYAEKGLTFRNDTNKGLKQETHKGRKKLVYILVGIFGGFGVLLLLALALLTFYWKICSDRTPTQTRPVHEANTAPPGPASVDLSGLGELFAYVKILEATNNFSDMNLMKHGHSGDIYKGMLENGFPVVVKRANLQSLQSNLYALELEFFRDVSHHPRLIPLLGHCLDRESEKCLVYKYMPNLDLSNSLYRILNSEDKDVQSLDWITRLKIAIGTAEALSYLHHECHPPLVHRDIQASSILLDDKYEVRLGSLSEVCVQGGDNHHNMISRFLQMPQSSATCAYDVYCFGKVLLELVTGKIGISNPNDNNTTKEWLERILPFINTSERERVSGIVDRSMIVDEDLLEEVWAVALVAKSCLNPRPSRRPIMRHVLKALENPFKVVRQDSSSGKLRMTTSSRRSWTAAFVSSWLHSSSDSANAASQGSREGTSGGVLKHTARLGSHSSVNEHSSSRNRSSSEIFPEPVETQDLERQDTAQLSRELCIHVMPYHK